MLNRDKRPVWICHRLRPEDNGYVDDGIERFSRPEQVFLNWSIKTSEISLQNFGENQSREIKVTQGKNELTKIFEGDQIYVEKIPNFNFDSESLEADYRVYSVIPGIRNNVIYLRKNA